jgi:metal-responsive CopG/Arc/MetJ family transcriptional regulator
LADVLEAHSVNGFQRLLVRAFGGEHQHLDSIVPQMISHLTHDGCIEATAAVGGYDQDLEYKRSIVGQLD